MLSSLPYNPLPAATAVGTGLASSRIAKRRALKMEDDDTNLVVSSKKPRLSPDVKPKTEAHADRKAKSASVVAAEIRHAIRNHKQGLDQEYHEIIEIFETLPAVSDGAATSPIRQYLHGMANSANLLDSACSELVHTVLAYRWLSSDDNAVVSTYLHFLKNLASLQSGYTTAVLDMLVRNFAHLSSSTGRPAINTLTKRVELQGRVHSALKQLLQQIPTAIAPLSKILVSNFPHSAESKKAHVEYVRNVLKVIEYAPALQSDILDLITDRLVSIDVKVQIDLEEVDYDIEEELLKSGYSLALQNGSSDADHNSRLYDSDSESIQSDDEDDLDAEELKSQELRTSVEKMDAIMDLLFAFLTPTFIQGQETAQANSMFAHLISQFSKTILPTYRSRHTQFLLFHFAQTASSLVNRFVDACVAILKQNSASSVFRISAAAYIASFTARATHILHSDVSYVFNTLASYLTRLQHEYEPTVSVSSRTGGPSLHRHPAYYSTFQALLYIFCFRWRDLLADADEYVEDDNSDIFDGNELAWAPGVRELFQSNVFCKLNPLKICAPEIVEEFARIAHHIKFIYVYQVIDSNKRFRLNNALIPPGSLGARETSLTGLHGDRPHQLDAYFPFDPYRLPISRKWLVGDYNEWKGVPGLHSSHTAVGDREDVSIVTNEDCGNRASFSGADGYSPQSSPRAGADDIDDDNDPDDVDDENM